MVAIQADGKVHVAPMAGTAPPQIAEPFIVAVGEALAAEGFDLAEGFENAAGSGRQHQDNDRREGDSARPRRSGRRTRRDDGLRL